MQSCVSWPEWHLDISPSCSRNCGCRSAGASWTSIPQIWSIEVHRPWWWRKAKLVGGLNMFEPLWKILVSWGYCLQYMEKWKLFQITNQKMASKPPANRLQTPLPKSARVAWIVSRERTWICARSPSYFHSPVNLFPDRRSPTCMGKMQICNSWHLLIGSCEIWEAMIRTVTLQVHKKDAMASAMPLDGFASLSAASKSEHCLKMSQVSSTF